jgi:MYXO-CTERM domain-containing protein
MGATMSMPAGYWSEVPVVPEADSVILLLGGLAALGVVAGWRARRREP